MDEGEALHTDQHQMVHDIKGRDEDGQNDEHAENDTVPKWIFWLCMGRSRRFMAADVGRGCCVVLVLVVASLFSLKEEIGRVEEIADGFVVQPTKCRNNWMHPNRDESCI